MMLKEMIGTRFLMISEAFLSAGKETSIASELRAKLAEQDRLVADLRDRLIMAETRERAAHERARKAEDERDAARVHRGA